MYDDLIDQISDSVTDEMDPNLVSDWLCENLDRSGPWLRITDEQSRVSSLLSCKLGQLGSHTYDLRQQLYMTSDRQAWLKLVIAKVIPLLKEDILYGD